MKHLTEAELIAYREGEVSQRAAITGHLSSCQDCHAELARIKAVFAALDTVQVPDPGEDYGRRVWQQIAPRLPQKPGSWWQAWLEPRRLAAIGTVAALILVAFLAGRVTKHTDSGNISANREQVRERILVVAVGEHLGRSEMMLIEISNAEPKDSKQKQVNISAEQRRAEDLLEENRLYRQTALQEGDAGLASVLDELERVLLDVAHSPQEVTPAQLDAIRQRIDSRGILFKVRVVSEELQQRQQAPHVPPAQNDSQKKERNKV
jgi:hypothetical protein